MNPLVWNCTATHNVFQDIFFWVSDKITWVSNISPLTHLKIEQTQYAEGNFSFYTELFTRKYDCLGKI